ncbi:MAG: hypothetical protein CBR30_03815 [Dictyoglomus sp. NZ13-RE01]|nr:MAG: hypothetical protein CBR30_03815 [Dictyoglomus sp. NZ13-RE01]
MSKLPILKSKDVVKALERLGFVIIRSKGSHLQLKRGNILVTVPIHTFLLDKNSINFKF